MNDKNDIRDISDRLAALRKERVGFSITSGAITFAESPMPDMIDVLAAINLEQLVTLLRQEVEKVLHLVGVDSLERINTDNISSDIAEDVAEYSYQILHIAIGVKEGFKVQVLKGNLMQNLSDLADWYNEEYIPHADKIENLHGELWLNSGVLRIRREGLAEILSSFTPDEIEKIIGRGLNPNGTNTLSDSEWTQLWIKFIEKDKEKDKAGIKNVFRTSISLLEKNYKNEVPGFIGLYLQNYKGEIRTTHYSDATKLIESDYFCPDNWVKNIDRLGPIFFPRKEKIFLCIFVEEFVKCIDPLYSGIV